MMTPISLLFLLLAFGCSSSHPDVVNGDSQATSGSDNILIVYLSRTNNTKVIAEIIQDKMGGDLVPLVLEDPYPENYDSIVRQVQRENETGFLPSLSTQVDLSKYDTIFLGFPTWGMRLPPPMKSFLSRNDLSGKTIIPFNTNAGYGVGSSFRTVEELSPNSTILEGFSIRGGIERDGVYLAIKGDRRKEAEQAVSEWLNRIILSRRSD